MPAERPQPSAPASPAAHPPPPSAGAAKIASPIRSVVQRMHDEGVTAANATTRTPTAYSNLLVRIDAMGRIHTDILVTHVDDRVVAALRAAQVRVEKAHTAADTVQGWIPFHRVEAVADLPFVRSIYPPRYAIRR